MLCEMTTKADRRCRMNRTPTQAKGCRNTLDDIMLMNSLKVLIEELKFLALIISSSSVSKEQYVFPLIFLNEALKNHHNKSPIVLQYKDVSDRPYSASFTLLR